MGEDRNFVLKDVGRIGGKGGQMRVTKIWARV